MPCIGRQFFDGFYGSTLKMFIQKNLPTITVGTDPIEKRSGSVQKTSD
jgi:hypothetical protein